MYYLGLRLLRLLYLGLSCSGIQESNDTLSRNNHIYGNKSLFIITSFLLFHISRLTNVYLVTEYTASQYDSDGYLWLRDLSVFIVVFGLDCAYDKAKRQYFSVIGTITKNIIASRQITFLTGI